MLTEKRIKELAVIAEATTPARHARLVNVIRLSVAETVEACAVMADEEAKKWWIRDEFSRFAAAIREKARTK